MNTEYWLHSLSLFLSNSANCNRQVFGTPLDDHLRISQQPIALVIEQCISILLNHCGEEGLFRIPGSTSKVKKLKSAFDAHTVTREFLQEFAHDPHTVATTLKLYLRELPDPLLTYALYEEWINAAK